MNTFTNLTTLLFEKTSSEPKKQEKIQSLINFLSAMSHPIQPELDTDDFGWVDDILSGANEEVIKDFFQYKGSNGNTIIHELFDHMEFLEVIREHQDYIDYSVTGNSGLTPVELAIQTLNPTVLEVLLEAGAPTNTFTDNTLLTNVSFDGREFSDMADESNMGLDDYVRSLIQENITLLEKYGANFTKEIKEDADQFESSLTF